MNPTRQIGVAGNLSGDAFGGIAEKVAFLSSPSRTRMVFDT
jgi:hypothetical protein